MNILFEDEDIVICIKPVGIISQEDNSGKESMISVLSKLCNCQIYPLHRLDREVGGVMVYAKNKNAAKILSGDIAERKFKKEYIAMVHGVPETPDGEMRDLLFKDSKKNKSFVVKRERKGVKEAVLEYVVSKTETKENGIYSIVNVLLHTGRSHQIRVQFASRKMPLAGDRKYGADDNFKNIALWSHKLEFAHPITKENLEFSSVDGCWFI